MEGRKYLLWPSLFLLFVRSSVSLPDHLASNTSDEGSLVVVTARRGSTACLPCAITSGRPSEPPLLVLWYRDSSVTPAYSYDSRVKHNHANTGDHARQWGDEEAWGGVQRAWLNTSATPAHLVIQSVRGRDEGVYRCIVHFRAAPSWAQRVALTVTDPPGYPRLQDKSGRRLEGPIGPYEEGDTVRMVCVGAGEPPPRLVWGGAAGLGRASEVVVRERVSRTTLTFVVSRALSHASITCASYNITSSSSFSSSSSERHLFTVTAVLRLNLPPLEVRLEAPGEWVTAGQVAFFRCVVMGSSPPPVIQWRLNGRSLDTHTALHHQESGNVSVSTVKVRPQHTDDGTLLECRAYSPRLPSHALHHSLRLTVHFVPVVTLKAPGARGESAPVPQGSSITLTCHLKANPPVFNVTWFHNGRPVQLPWEDVKANNTTLRLNNVTAAVQGLYTCVGSNVEGDGQSNALHLDVMFRPVCASVPELHQDYEVASGGDVTLKCSVKAHPAPLTFTWALKNTTNGSLTRLLTARREKGMTGRYTLRGVTGPLEVWCWARNSVGTQATPCRLTIRTYSVHGYLRGCGVSNHTSSGFTMVCSQVVSRPNLRYILSVYVKERRRDDVGKKSERDNWSENEEEEEEEEEAEEEEEGRTHLHHLRYLVKNLTASLPFFRVDGLRAGQEFVVVMWTLGEGGLSPPIVLNTYTLDALNSTAQKRIVGLEHPRNSTDGGGEEWEESSEGTEGGETGEQGLWSSWVLEGTGAFKLLMFVVFLSGILVLTTLASCVVRRRREGPPRQRLRQMKLKELRLSSHQPTPARDVPLLLTGPITQGKVKKEALEETKNSTEGDDGGGDDRSDGIYYINLRQPPSTHLPPKLSLLGTPHNARDDGDPARTCRREKARLVDLSSEGVDNGRGCTLCRL